MVKYGINLDEYKKQQKENEDIFKVQTKNKKFKTGAHVLLN